MTNLNILKERIEVHQETPTVLSLADSPGVHVHFADGGVGRGIGLNMSVPYGRRIRALATNFASIAGAFTGSAMTSVAA